MLILRDPSQLANVINPEIRDLLQQRFREICDPEPYDPEMHGQFFLVQPGDSAESLAEETGINLFGSLFDEAVFGDPDFTPYFEYLIDNGSSFEAVFILTDSGYASVFIIPKAEGVDRRILELCAEFAEPTN